MKPWTLIFLRWTEQVEAEAVCTQSRFHLAARQPSRASTPAAEAAPPSRRLGHPNSRFRRTVGALAPVAALVHLGEPLNNSRRRPATGLLWLLA